MPIFTGRPGAAAKKGTCSRKCVFRDDAWCLFECGGSKRGRRLHLGGLKISQSPEGTRRGFVRNASLLTLGAVIAQLVGAGALALTGRLYSTSAFGEFGVYFAVVTLGSAVFGLKFDQAIPVAELDADARALKRLALMTGGGMTVLGILLLFALAQGDRELAIHGSTWFLGVGSAGWLQTLLSMSLRQKKYAANATARIAQAALQAILALALAFTPLAAIGLVLSDTLSRALAGTILALRSREERVPPSQFRTVSQKFSDFPRYYLPANLANAASLQIFPLLLPAIFGAALAGQFFLAFRVVVAPLGIIASSASQVLLSEATGPMDRRRDQVRFLSSHIPAIALPAAAWGFAMAPLLFPLVFGSQWHAAGSLAAWLVLAMPIWLTAGSLSGLLLIGKKLGQSLLYTLGDLVARSLVLVLGWITHGLVLTTIGFSIAASLIGLLSIRRFLQVVEQPFGAWLRDQFLLPLAGFGLIIVANELAHDLSDILRAVAITVFACVTILVLVKHASRSTA